MGLIGALAGIGGLVRDAGGLAEIVTGNRKAENAAQHEEFIAALQQLSSEFEQERESWFDILISGLNRLPRPALALGTLGLFVYAMADPIGFSGRMQGLALVPDQLWWLLGAIVSFYFGAREMHYLRKGRPAVQISDLIRVTEQRQAMEALRPAPETSVDVAVDIAPARFAGIEPKDPDFNAAIEDWLTVRG